MTARSLSPPRWMMFDMAERVVCALLYAYFFHNILLGFLRFHQLTGLVVLLSESTVLVFVLIRRPTAAISRQPLDWALALVGTTMPLLVVPADGTRPLLPEAAVLVVMVAGGLFQLGAKLVLRRSFGLVAANRGIKMSGPYRIVRHPIYAGYIVTQAGFLLGNPTPWNLAVYAIAWAAQLARIIAEERLLLGDADYRDFAGRVRYRLIPGVF